MSVAKTDSGEPHLNITQVRSIIHHVLHAACQCVCVCVCVQAGEGVTVRVLNFKQIQVFLSCTGDKKLNEVRLCLEGNDLFLINRLCN